MAEIQEEFYHGWTIQIAQEQVGYTFQCWMSKPVGEQVSFTDAQYYSTVEHALRIGRWRADLESMRLSLTTFLQGKFQFLLLNSAERNALENSIAQYIDVARHQLG
ncbi:MAG: hypothetical protein Kow00121_06710 [Elainellaceae cyanobacterium]